MLAVPVAGRAPAAGLGVVLAETLDELRARVDGRGGAVDGADGEKGGPTVRETRVGDEARMGDGADPGFLSADEIRLTRLSCPECNGGLAEIDLSGLRYYRCHVGHQYSPQSLEAAQREAVEARLWAAAAALEEHAALARHLATQPGEGLGPEAVDGYRRLADRSNSTAKALISRLESGDVIAPPIVADESRGAATSP